jgi:peptidoglycan/xylan/chitin deacetylase (PgdA/CDA1 family)
VSVTHRIITPHCGTRPTLFTRMYYAVKPLLPRHTQLDLRRERIRRRMLLHSHVWPIDEEAGRPPLGWWGWPDQKEFALVLTHDVEHYEGQRKCIPLARIERDLGFRSSFYFVPERYDVSRAVREELVAMGCEVGVHDYNHDGRLFSSEQVFSKRAASINRYIREWNACGFRAGAMFHNLEWIGRLEVKYDCSTFDTDPFEPQPEGVRTIFPFRVHSRANGREYVEMPYTMPQDFTLFVLMRETDPAIWLRKLDWVASKGGVALVNVHPDYVSFDSSTTGAEQYPLAIYVQLLQYVAERYRGKYWHVLARDLARYWRSTAHGEPDVIIA